MNEPAVRLAVARTALMYLPPSMREAVCDDADFRKQYHLSGDYVLRLQNDTPCIRRSALTRAVRLVLAGAKEKKLPDTDGRRWKLRSGATPHRLPELQLSRGSERRQLPLAFVTLSPDRATRLKLLQETESTLNLPTESVKRWHDVLADRSLNDDELVAFLNDVFDSPVDMAVRLCDTIRSGRFDASTLVPNSRRYFFRLVGEYDGSSTVHAYAAHNGGAHVRALSRWNPTEGFIYGLYLASHSSLTTCVAVDATDSAQLISLLQRVRDSGDRMSQVGALEVGLRALSARPEIATILADLVEAIRDDDASRPNSRTVLLSSLFHLVDGQLSRTKLFSQKEPYYRRLAALAHSAVLHGAIINSSIDRDEFIDWAVGHNREQCELQTYVDMRTDPYWHHHFATPTQMKAELVGRIMIAASQLSKPLESHEKLRSLLQTLPKCLAADNDAQSLCMFLRGPLDGKKRAGEKPPATVVREIRKRLNAEEVAPYSFVPFANAALLYHIDDDLVALAAQALRRDPYGLQSVRSEVVSIAMALAIAAAVCRSVDLADGVRDLVLRYIHNGGRYLSVADKLDVVLTLSASRSDEIEWARCVGAALENIAFGDLEDQERRLVQSCIHQLCHLKPELWTYVGRAEAAVASLGAFG